MNLIPNSLKIFVSRINRRHFQLIMMILYIVLFILGASVNLGEPQSPPLLPYIFG